MIQILIADDHAAFRQPLAFMLEREPDLVVAWQAGSLAESRLALEQVDVAIIDLDLPDGNGLHLIRELRTSKRANAILVLTGTLDRGQHARAVEAGASGVLHKSVSIETIIDAVRRLAAGEVLFAPREILELIQLAAHEREQDKSAEAALGSLTPRELEILQALADGLSDKGIGQRLSISTETVRTHMVNILRKLNVGSRLEALVFMLRYGKISISYSK